MFWSSFSEGGTADANEYKKTYRTVRTKSNEMCTLIDNGLM